MIGDWVYDTLSQTNIKVNRGCFEINPLNGICYAENLIPIPLTKEIFEKNGFEKLRESRFLLEDLEDNYWVKFYPKDTNYTCGAYDYIDIDCGCLSIREMPIKFVHELQNALRLCGITREIIV